jgi:hypothetical protein
MLIPTLLVGLFAVGFLGMMMARTDGSALYVAFCLFSPVLLPIWFGMQLGEMFVTASKKLSQASQSEVSRFGSRIAFTRPMRSRALSARPSCVAPVAQH